MTVYSSVRRANVPNICGIPSVGSALKSGPALFDVPHTDARARVRARANARLLSGEFPMELRASFSIT